MGVSGLADGLPLVDVLGLVGEGGGRRVGDHQGGAAGGVHLPVVMPLHDLHIVVAAQDGSGPAHQLQQHIDAQGHVPGAEDGHQLGGLVDGGQLLLRVAGGGQDQGDLAGGAELQQALEGGGGWRSR